MVLFSWNHFGYSNPTADLGLGEGTIVFDEQHPAQSSVEVTLPLARLDTHVAALDEHLKKADFLDAAKYPVVNFKGSRSEERRVGNGCGSIGESRGGTAHKIDKQFNA